jgi:LmbE family N-acetylglucosaminyl deacetylase
MITDPKTVAFFHAHPDDEAIFTAGTMARLAADGHHVVLVMATGGEHGLGASNCGDGFDRGAVGAIRHIETERAAAILGIATVIACGFEDSGLDGENRDGLAHQRTDHAADRVADLLGAHDIRPDVWVTYDQRGIYGHPDHIAVHEIGRAVAELTAPATLYEATVDREYLHFVETHVVIEAGLPDHPRELGLAGTDLGSATLEVDVELDVTSMLAIKRAAMAAHASQIPPHSTAMRMAPAAFAAVYGFEWYRRVGPPNLLDALAAGSTR